jgi:acetoin utilization protein AcuB
VKSPPTVRRVMTPFPWSIEAGRTVAEAWMMMSEHGIRHLPVTQDGELVGLVSGRDLGLAMDARLGAPRAAGLSVGELAEREPYMVDLTTPVEFVAREMAERRLGSALVTRQGKLVGIFTTTDACRLLADLLGGRRPDDDDDVA